MCVVFCHISRDYSLQCAVCSNLLLSELDFRSITRSAIGKKPRVSHQSNQLFHAQDLSECGVINRREGVEVLSGGALIKGHGI